MPRRHHHHHHHHHHGPPPPGPPPPHHGPPSHNYPPGGPPPPYSQPYPLHLHAQPPPPPASYAYVPAPVVMPVPMPVPGYHPPPASNPLPPQPTYVTNYIYNQPEQPSPVTIVDSPAPTQQVQDSIDWIPATTSNAGQLAHRAVVAGKEPGWNSSPIWVIRAHHNGNLVPGKLAINDRGAYIPMGGKEVPVHNFEVLSAPPHAVRWVSSSNGQVPVGAIAAGNTAQAEPLYIGRVRHRGAVTPGKVHPSHGCLYISFGGAEVPHKSYEVLCKIVG